MEEEVVRGKEEKFAATNTLRWSLKSQAGERVGESSRVESSR